jgi:hypothetical protein
VPGDQPVARLLGERDRAGHEMDPLDRQEGLRPAPGSATVARAGRELKPGVFRVPRPAASR